MAHGRKTGGRKAGTPNKITSDLKCRIAALVEDQFSTVKKDFRKLEPKDRVTAYLKFLEYILPKQREHKADIANRIGSLDDEQLNNLIDAILTQKPESHG
ncbi:hypothetical protein F5984_15175 [Rudanella paleaurantiibacter]|uniref:Uncharacterized protein n=1 Tax=Rudanella paleaurantiibacter TaxID=2614655 RepID=A0A7J5TZB4_9BACT|nr:hypothetical protein [Rudanella paleaurantiibacter]KAB7730482.1 hypothetical protein F5984_15175 [Rudanella paleaurantiibacter]